MGGLWALEWEWHIAETNLRCVRSSGICTPNLNSLLWFPRSRRSSGRTDRRTWLDRLSSDPDILNTYTLWGRKRFLLPVTYFSTNLVYLLLYE